MDNSSSCPAAGFTSCLPINKHNSLSTLSPPSTREKSKTTFSGGDRRLSFGSSFENHCLTSPHLPEILMVGTDLRILSCLSTRGDLTVEPVSIVVKYLPARGRLSHGKSMTVMGARFFTHFEVVVASY